LPTENSEFGYEAARNFIESHEVTQRETKDDPYDGGKIREEVSRYSLTQVFALDPMRPPMITG
jgi:hypothetical protein